MPFAMNKEVTREEFFKIIGPRDVVVSADTKTKTVTFRLRNGPVIGYVVGCENGKYYLGDQ